MSLDMSPQGRSGRSQARRDRYEMEERVRDATDAQIGNRWWRVRQILHAYWVGFTAPSLFSREGRAYNREMKSASNAVIAAIDAQMDRLAALPGTDKENN